MIKKGKKFLLLLLFVLLAALTITPVALASNLEEPLNSHVEDFKVIKNESKIIVEWNALSKANKYIVKYDDAVIYEGSDTQFEINNLAEGDMNEFELAVVDNNGLVISNSHLKIYTTLLDQKEIGIDTFATSSNVVLDWPDVEQVVEYSVYRDDQFVGITNESKFTEELPQANTKYQYSITAEVPLSIEELQERENKLKMDFENYGIIDGEELDTSSQFSKVSQELKENPYDLIEFSTIVYTLESLKNDITSKSFIETEQVSPLALISKSWVKINTMILNTPAYPGFLPAPVGNYYYGTDDRTSITSQGSTRSSLEASINWSTLAVGETKSIGWTNRYTKNSNGTYTFVDRKQASGNNVNLGATKKTSSMIDINFVHKAAHPYYSVAPNVEYEFRSEIYKDGTTKIRGYHTLFPSLGIFRSDGGGYRDVYTHNQGSRTPWDLYSHKTIDVTK